MKKEHIDLVWESLEDFDRANISFGDFLEHLGRALESASIPEAKIIGEATRNLEFALVSGSSNEVRRIMKSLKAKVVAQLHPTD
ncbi:MAG: hypothetical protein ACOYXC_06595 [Candidatus Rifleibacteriota bacterium]